MQRYPLVGSPNLFLVNLPFLLWSHLNQFTSNTSFEPASLGLRVLYSGLVCTKVHQTLPLGTIRVALASNKVDRG